MAVPRADTGTDLGDPQPAPRPAANRWKTVEDLFNAASEMNPRDRETFLAAVCGEDRPLRQEVESLLAAAERTLGLLQQPVREAARSVAAVEPLGHRRIGNFELIKLIGEGGMGEVYLAARADDQFRQYVAIHAAPWHDEYGSPRSHGCINLSADRCAPRVPVDRSVSTERFGMPCMRTRSLARARSSTSILRATPLRGSLGSGGWAPAPTPAYSPWSRVRCVPDGLATPDNYSPE